MRRKSLPTSAVHKRPFQPDTVWRGTRTTDFDCESSAKAASGRQLALLMRYFGLWSHIPSCRSGRTWRLPWRLSPDTVKPALRGELGSPWAKIKVVEGLRTSARVRMSAVATADDNIVGHDAILSTSRPGAL